MNSLGRCRTDCSNMVEQDLCGSDGREAIGGDQLRSSVEGSYILPAARSQQPSCLLSTNSIRSSFSSSTLLSPHLPGCCYPRFGIRFAGVWRSCRRENSSPGMYPENYGSRGLRGRHAAGAKAVIDLSTMAQVGEKDRWAFCEAAKAGSQGELCALVQGSCSRVLTTVEVTGEGKAGENANLQRGSLAWA